MPPALDAVWQRGVMLLPVSDQRTAVDLTADPLPLHLPPVELQARVHRMHILGGQLCGCPGGKDAGVGFARPAI